MAARKTADAGRGAAARQSGKTPSEPAGMIVFSRELELPMCGELDIIDITSDVRSALGESGILNGGVTVFIPGATGAITCLEYEPGVIADFRAAVERIAPRDMHYDHNVFQADGNGHSHVRAGLLGPSLAVPVVGGELTLGIWQQIVVVNFDNRTRTRKVIVQVTGA